MTEWDALYGSGRYDNVTLEANFSQLVRNFAHKGAAILELGCGAGVNVPIFVTERMDYAGIDGSSVAIKQAEAKYPYLRGRFVCCDFTASLPCHGAQIICERASLPHNDIQAIQRCVDMIRDALPVGGGFISSDWFSTSHSDFGKGTPHGQDTFTFSDGQFVGAGKVHFSDESELRELFHGFECRYLVERITRYVKRDERAFWHRDDASYQGAVWDMVWKKQ